MLVSSSVFMLRAGRCRREAGPLYQVVVFEGMLRADVLSSDLWLRVQVCSLGSAFQGLLRKDHPTPSGHLSPEVVVLHLEFG